MGQDNTLDRTSRCRGGRAAQTLLMNVVECRQERPPQFRHSVSLPVPCQNVRVRALQIKCFRNPRNFRVAGKKLVSPSAVFHPCAMTTVGWLVWIFRSFHDVTDCHELPFHLLRLPLGGVMLVSIGLRVLLNVFGGAPVVVVMVESGDSAVGRPAHKFGTVGQPAVPGK